jgi:predicted lipoprotein with Yx(FWY)xxD motif
MAMAVLAAACGDSGSDAEAASTEAPTATTAAPAAATTAAPSAMADMGEVAVASNALGDILVDGDGMTVYLFTNDAKDGTSACNDGCISAWPAVVGEVMAGDGVDSAKLGSITRDDGTEQATYNDWPLYYFGGDAAAGDANGQGSGGVWFTLDSAGVAIS